MLKKLSLLLLLCSLCMWAADFWTTKPFTDWNEKEVQKMLTNSPWSGKVTVSASVGGGLSAPGGGRGGGGRGGGRGGPQGDSIDPGIDGGGGGPAVANSGVSVLLLWQTALPVRQASIKLQYGAEAGTSPEAKAKLDRVEQAYVLSLSGMPGFALGAAQGDRKAFLESTTLTVAGKPPVSAIDVQVSAGGRGGAVVYLAFPRTTAFTASDGDMEFVSKFGVTTVKHKFKLKDMVFNGKLEM